MSPAMKLKEILKNLPQYNWRNVTRNGDIKKCVLVEGVRLKSEI